MLFRNVKEAEGDTFLINRDENPHIGTYFLMSCIGVYFKVDEGRCFFAHMDASTPEVWPFMMVTPKAGLEISNQVKNRLRDFMQKDSWDIKSEEFGKNLTLQCSHVRNWDYSGKEYETPGKYVIQGVREFFNACAQVMGEENEKLRKFGLARRSNALGRIADNAIVRDKYHVMIVDTVSGQLTGKLGRVVDPPRDAIYDDLEGNIPIDQALPKFICKFGVMEDDRNAFPASALGEEDHRSETRRDLGWVSDEYQNFGGQPEGATAKRLSQILHESHVQLGPGWDPDDLMEVSD